MSTANYSAMGKISKLLIFDTAEYMLESPIPEEAYARIWDTFKFFVYDINAYHEVAIYVFFRIHPEGVQVDRWNDKRNNITYIPVNLNGQDCRIESKWIQDCLIFGEGGSVFVTHSMVNGHMQGLINKYVGKNCYQFMPVDPTYDGGNILKGKKKNGEDFWLAGNPGFLGKGGKLEKPNLGMKAKTIIMSLHNSTLMANNSYFFYHLDIYVTLIGPTKGPDDDTQLLLVADVLPKYTEIKAALDWVEKEAIKQGAANGIVFEIERVPFPVIEDTNGRPVFGVTFNNCIVENYFENDLRVINLYFPDYRDNINTLITLPREISVGKIKHDLKEFSLDEESPAQLSVTVHLQYEGPLAKEIRKSEVELTKTLSNRDIFNITFVRYPFFQELPRLGSLHCMTIAAERIEVDHSG